MLSRHHHTPPPVEDGGLTIDVSLFGLLLLAVVGYVVHRVAQARRRGESGTAAAGRALAEAAPPAVAAGIGIVLLYVAVAFLVMALVVSVMVFAFTAPFAAFEAAFTGNEPEYALGPVGGLAAEAYLLMFVALLFFLGAATWVAVVAVRRSRERPAARTG